MLWRERRRRRERIFTDILWRDTDDPEKYIDAPISLQLVGRRYEDEKVLEALELITEVAGLPFSTASSGADAAGASKL